VESIDMKRSQINLPPCYYDRYIAQVDDLDIHDALERSLTELQALDRAQLRRIGTAVYAEGKWTLNAVFQHLIDVEHVLAYRSLRIGRYDTTPLPGFDQDVLARNVNADARMIDELVDELLIVRQGTARLFKSFTGDALEQVVPVNDTPMSPLAFGFTIIGHQKHHLRLVYEKYFPMIEAAHQLADA
jgi:hypothetical protein